MTELDNSAPQVRAPHARAPHVAVLTPCFGGMVTAAYANSLLLLQAACLQAGVKLEFNMSGGDGMITRARAELVAWFLDTPCTHLIFIDADIGFTPEQFFRLLAFDRDFVCAAYPIKRVDYDKVARAVQAGKTPLEQASQTYVIAWKDAAKVEASLGFARVRYAGGGFTMVRREVIERMCAAHPELRYHVTHARGLTPEQKALSQRFALFDPIIDHESGEYLSEDFAFSKRWTDLGGDIWVDLNSRLDHYGPSTFRGDLSTQLQRQG